MTKPFKLLIVFLIVTIIIGIIPKINPAEAQTDAVAGAAADPRFGAIESFWRPDEAAELGVGWDRILFYWNEIQPDGPNDWNTLHVLEEWLVEANNQERTIVGVLKNTPAWATDGESVADIPRGLYLPVNDPGNLWANYVRQTARYYGPRGVHHWIVWNEPDIAPGTYGYEFGGTTADYYRLVKVAYKVMKQVDPYATIHLGGMTYWHDPGYLRRYLDIAIADPEAAENDYFFDVISLHVYFRPETMQLIVGNAFSAQSEKGIDPLKPVWVNETNARPSQDPEWPVEVQAFELDLEQQAWYIPQAFALGFYAGAGRMAVYKLVDVNIGVGQESWGLIRPYDFSKRPAFYAYQTTIDYLSGFVYPIRREVRQDYFVINFTRPQGLTRVMWARTPASLTLQVPALAESAKLVNVMGAVERVTAVNGLYTVTLEGARCDGECLIGGPPLFLVEEDITVDQVPAVIPPPLPTATITATATIMASSTPLSSATFTPSPTPADTPQPTSTLMPTAVPANTAVPSPTATEIALVVATETATAIAAATAAATSPPQMTPNDQPDSQASWWFLGSGVGLGLVLMLFVWARRPSPSRTV